MNKFEEFRYKLETYLESVFSSLLFLGELLVYIIAYAWFFAVKIMISLWENFVKQFDKLLIFLSNLFS